MSGSVSIDIDALSGAISALTGLAGRIDSQRNAVVSGTPCELPSLSEGTLGAVSAWLNDQEPELSTRLDLARLLASEGAKVVSYTTDADTLANVQKMLGHEMAERVNDVSYDTDDEDLDELNEILGRRVERPRGHELDVPGPRARGHRAGPHGAGDAAGHVRRRLGPGPRQDHAPGTGHRFERPQLLRRELCQRADAAVHRPDAHGRTARVGERQPAVQQRGSLADGLLDEGRRLLTRVPHRRREQARRVRATVRRQRLAGRQLVVLPHRNQPVQ